MRRISTVHDVLILNVEFSSIVHLGDNVVIKPRSKALAVNRELPVYLGNEGEFANYPLFSRPIPQLEASELIEMDIHNKSGFIKVNHIKILGIAEAAVFQVGSCEVIDAESRIKQFRQLLPRD
jgi:spore germination protein PE